MLHISMFSKAVVTLAAMVFWLLLSMANAQVRQSDRCEVPQACRWSFQSPNAGALQIIRDTHERKLKNRHFRDGSGTVINNEFLGGQTNNTSMTVGNWNQNFGDGNIIANQSNDESLLSAETNTWSGGCTENCNQTSDDSSAQSGDGHHRKPKP